MLLKCPRCSTHYEVEDELFVDPTVQVQCESCDVVLVRAAPAPKVQDEKTSMLAAFDEAELEKLIGRNKPAAPAPARSPAQRRPGNPAPFDPAGPPTQKLEPLTPARLAAAAAEDLGSTVAQPGAAERPGGGRVPLAGTDGALSPRRGKRPSAGQLAQEDPFAAGAGAELDGDPGSAGPNDLAATRRAKPEEAAPRARQRSGGPLAADEDEPADDGWDKPARSARPAPPVEEEAPRAPREPPSPVKVTPIGLLVVVPLLVLAFLGGSAWLLLGLRDGGEEKGGPAAGKPMSYKVSLGVMIQRNQGSYASTKLTQEVSNALPLFVHEDGIRIRATNAVELESGRVPRAQRQGLLIKDLAVRLAQELAPYKPPAPAAKKGETDDDEGEEAAAPPPAPLGRGAKALVLVAEAGVPFETIGRILFTAESVGYRKLYLAGQAADAPESLRGLELTRLSWVPSGPGEGGLGLGVTAGAEGLVLFERSGAPLPGAEPEAADGAGKGSGTAAAPGKDKADRAGKDAKETRKPDRLEIPRGATALTELAAGIKQANSGNTYKELTLQPGPTVTYEQLLGLLETLTGAEDGAPLIPDLVLAGANIF